ncbi:putative ABC transporter permease protein [Candidatus Promineifilum breve]|uniref:ABC transporter permease protein n=1 Tax=Candidatus Promineifilum breve TaxID=1806508 RepID=A0A160T9K3_9CHLR|nr:ABC transporter permease [Candidatus Promineifilum breve]CUS05955.1 putative ABC transporter permease protein [Candidatus Promineifilum breve]
MFNKLIAIFRKDTILRFEGWSELLFFLILPIIFTFIIGGGLSSGGPGEDNREVVPVVDEDGGPAAADLVAALAASETIRPEAYGRAEAEELLDGNDVGAILIIPAGFSDGLTAAGQAGDPAEIVVRSAPGNNIAIVVEQEVQRAAGAIARPRLIAAGAAGAVAAVQPFPDDAARAAFQQDALAAAETALSDQPARVEFSTLGGGSGEYSQQAQSSAGQLITWVFIPLLGASGLFVMERSLGTLRRLMVTPTRKSTFLLGSIGGQYLFALLQMTLLVLFGLYVMGVPWGNAPLALAVVLAAFGLAGVALGTTLGTFVKTESQAGSLSIILGMTMGMLGGAMWPMELFPPALQQVVKVLPTTWAMSALTDLTMRGGGMADILPEAAVLLGFAVVFFVIGVWRFRYE